MQRTQGVQYLFDSTGIASVFIVIIIVVIVIIGGWLFYDNQLQEAALNHLVESGFQIDHKLDGEPAVVFDEQDKKIAFVSSKRTTVYGYEQILSWEWGEVERKGWMDKTDGPTYPILTFKIQYEREPSILVDSIEDVDQNYWREQLKRILGQK